jgi:hypothetical protein
MRRAGGFDGSAQFSDTTGATDLLALEDAVSFFHDLQPFELLIIDPERIPAPWRHWCLRVNTLPAPVKPRTLAVAVSNPTPHVWNGRDLQDWEISMNQPDPQLTITCPKCGKPLCYVSTKSDPGKTYLYICAQDGVFEVTGDVFGPLSLKGV